MTEKDFLRRIKMTPPDMTALLHSGEAELLAKALLADTDARGRFCAKKVIARLEPQLNRFCAPPAAGHDIGKYGCKKSEEKRIPYLHY